MDIEIKMHIFKHKRKNMNSIQIQIHGDIYYKAGTVGYT